MDKEYLLELITRPAFYVADGVITSTNEPARQRQILPGTQITDLISTGLEEYHTLADGCLFLTLRICDVNYGASVTTRDGAQLFLLESEAGNKELQAVSLAANQLREPMSNIMILADQYFSSAENIPQEQLASLKGSLYQMLRTIYNMSDASTYATKKLNRPTTENLPGIINEIMEKAAHAIAESGRKIAFQPLSDGIYALCEKELLERAILNLVSNAAKFSPEGSEIQARLTRRDQKLLFTIENPYFGSSTELRGDIFSRFLREPGIEDTRNGIGLGMVIVRSAAMAHGGTILWEVPQDQTVRITLSIALRKNRSSDVRSPHLSFDYTGGRDHVLIELADALPDSAFKNI